MACDKGLWQKLKFNLVRQFRVNRSNILNGSVWTICPAQFLRGHVNVIWNWKRPFCLFKWCSLRNFVFHYRCLKDFNTVKHGSPESSVSRKIFSDHWNVKVAPLSGNIIWEHLSVDNESWWARALLINTLLFIFVLFLTTPTVILSSIQELEATIGEWRVTEIL